MAKRHFTEDSYLRDPWFRALVKVVAGLKTEEDIAAFLRDIGTLSELQAWSERLEVVRQLKAGKTYREIAKQTGASTTTVTRVARFLEAGKRGYKTALQTLS